MRAINPAATICAYGLYAQLNEPLMREHGAMVILGLVIIAKGGEDGITFSMFDPSETSVFGVTGGGVLGGVLLGILLFVTAVIALLVSGGEDGSDKKAPSSASPEGRAAQAAPPPTPPANPAAPGAIAAPGGTAPAINRLSPEQAKALQQRIEADPTGFDSRQPGNRRPAGAVECGEHAPFRNHAGCADRIVQRLQ